MKDYYDLYAVPQAVNITEVELEAAITATFGRRQTDIPIDIPPGLADKFTGDSAKQTPWVAYSESTDASGLSLADVAADIWERLGPICRRRREGA